VLLHCLGDDFVGTSDDQALEADDFLHCRDIHRFVEWWALEDDGPERIVEAAMTVLFFL
jgi:hypothetical protein